MLQILKPNKDFLAVLEIVLIFSLAYPACLIISNA